MISRVRNRKPRTTEEKRNRKQTDGQKYFSRTPEQKEARSRHWKERYRNDADYKRSCLDRSLKNKLGISLIQKEVLLESQNGKCASCGAICPGTSGHTDHAHDETKFIRGILRRACNILLGFLEKQSDRIKLLDVYIKRKPDFVFEVD